jgi:hypothetical protein
MASWEEKQNEELLRVTEVECFIEREFFVRRHDKFSCEAYNRNEDPWSKTIVIDCGYYDGEKIDLFQLQEWFDRNREWIDQLRRETNEQPVQHFQPDDRAEKGLVVSREGEVR